MSHTTAPCDPLTTFPNHSPPELLSTCKITILNAHNVQPSSLYIWPPLSAATHQLSPAILSSAATHHVQPSTIAPPPSSGNSDTHYKFLLTATTHHLAAPLHLHDSVCAPSMLMLSFSTSRTHKSLKETPTRGRTALLITTTTTSVLIIIDPTGSPHGCQ